MARRSLVPCVRRAINGRDVAALLSFGARRPSVAPLHPLPGMFCNPRPGLHSAASDGATSCSPCELDVYSRRRLASHLIAVIGRGVAVIRGILGILIALLGIVLLVAGWLLGGLSDDPQTQMIGGVAGVACLIVGGYLLYRAIRPASHMTNP